MIYTFLSLVRSVDTVGVQIVSLPNLQIIDFGYGYTGSTHDATAWEATRMAKEHSTLLEHGEWIWADSAYPVCSTFTEQCTRYSPTSRSTHGL